MLLTTHGVFYLPSLQYTTAILVFGFPVVAAATRTLVEVNIVLLCKIYWYFDLLKYVYYRYKVVDLIVYTSNLRLYQFEIMPF